MHILWHLTLIHHTILCASVPSSLSIGWPPPARSMTDSRRCPSAAVPSEEKVLNTHYHIYYYDQLMIIYNGANDVILQALNEQLNGE